MVSKNTMVAIESATAKHTTNAVSNSIVSAEDIRTGESTPAKPGMISSVKNLYQGKKDDNRRRQWVETYPDDLDAPAENAETARYALLIRNVKCYDGRRKLQIESIIIQSPLLRDALGSVLDSYPGITTGIDRATFSPPFEPFVHRWNKLRDAVENESHLETKAHLKLLYDVLEEELRNEIEARDDLLAHGVITFIYAWMLFEPGTIVYSTKDGEPCAVRLNDGRYMKTPCGNTYTLNCHTVDWDGENFGYGSTKLSIPDFVGTKPITQLTALPLALHPNKDQVTSALIERGKSFERLAGYHYKAYQGVALGEGPWGPVKYNVNSRIIVDTYAWNRFQPNSSVSVSTLDFGNKSTEKRNYREYRGDHDEYSSDFSGEENETDGADETMEVMGKAKKPRVRPLTQDQLLLCTAILKGYSLKDKKWLTFFIRFVKEIQWSDNAFSSLVLPEDQKDLILALTKSQRVNRGAFDDVIQGKGMGMIMLLSGPPGIGKTLTAESVAENMRTPLYMMAASDLGSDSSDVEKNFSKLLEMIDKWNAVLLLDEADVFLEERSTHDLERNKLVSIFLRILEYHSGILFLTTNRGSNIDPAFRSRIHISMAYQELSRSSRRQVWSNFIAGSAQKSEFSPEDLDSLSKYKMNGREIKNVLKTAQLLASSNGAKLGLGHVKRVLGIEKRFSEEQ